MNDPRSPETALTSTVSGELNSANALQRKAHQETGITPLLSRYKTRCLGAIRDTMVEPGLRVAKMREGSRSWVA